MRTLTLVGVLLLSLVGMDGAIAQTNEETELFPVPVDQTAPFPPFTTMEMVTVKGQRLKSLAEGGYTAEEMREYVLAARALLEETKLHFVVEVNKRTKVRSLRGRPVLFAAHNPNDDSWHLITVEMPIPAKPLYQGRPYTHFKVVTPGYRAEHFRGTGGPILMFRFYKGDEKLYVFGRKYPDLDLTLLRSRKFEALVDTATIKYHTPYTPDLFHEDFVEEGRLLLERAAENALLELRERNVRSFTYPEQTVGDTIRPEQLVVLALNEQMDHYHYRVDRMRTMKEVLNQYGLYGEDAYDHSVSSANAIGPMQFTNKPQYKTKKVRVKRRLTTVREQVYPGTYNAMLGVCAEARLDPSFESGSRDLHNAMKAAACLLDMELRTLARGTPALRSAYANDPDTVIVLSVSAYNGGEHNAKRLYRWLSSRRILEQHIIKTPILGYALPKYCPCLWVEDVQGKPPRQVPLTNLNEENKWYVEKYLFVLSALYGNSAPSP